MMNISSQCSSNTFAVQIVSNLLKHINIETLMISLIYFEQWSEMQAEHACQRYLKFLYLVWLYPDHPLIPTQEIDRVWHCHILHTRQYQQDCQTLFGCYLDHVPCANPEQLDPSLLIAFEQTKILFERHFGVGSFDSCLSNDPAACGCPLP